MKLYLLNLLASMLLSGMVAAQSVPEIRFDSEPGLLKLPENIHLGEAAGVATDSLISAGILLAYFAVVYSVVMRREEGELLAQHGEAFHKYAAAVPLFLPRLRAAELPGAGAGEFSFAQYKKNHEYQAALGYLLLLSVLLILWRWHLG